MKRDEGRKTSKMKIMMWYTKELVKSKNQGGTASSGIITFHFGEGLVFFERIQSFLSVPIST
jgi:hypothetical protein